MKNIFTILFSLMFVLNVSAIGNDSPNEEANKEVTFIELASPEAVVVSNLNFQQEMKKIIVIGCGSSIFAQSVLNLIDQRASSELDVLLVPSLESVKTISMELKNLGIKVETLNSEPILKHSVSKYISPPQYNYRCR